MANEFDIYKKKKQFLVCVDSDGCAIDSMDIKHINCFGPRMVEQWELFSWKDSILSRWNDINLYTLTRGINRFKGLLMALKEIDAQYKKIDDLESLEKWVTTTNELSNNSLQKAIDENQDSICLKKALSWSNAVNASIKELPKEQVLPYEMVKEALEFAHLKADVAIVSSANLGAVMEEWERHNLLEHTDIVLAQNAGSKSYCIKKLLEKGYEQDCVVMCGDALGDLEAAKENGVFYYPILVKHEKESWVEFIEKGFNHLISKTYSGEYQKLKIKEFMDNLSK